MSGPSGKQNNSKVGIEQGAERIWVDPDGYFNVDGADVLGTELKYNSYDVMQRATIGQGATSTAFSVINLPDSVGYVVLSMISNLVQGSFWLTSVLQGRVVTIKIHCGSVASGSVAISTSGCSIVGLAGTDISVIHLLNSTNSTAIVTLRAYADDEWTVIDALNGVVLD